MSIPDQQVERFRAELPHALFGAIEHTRTVHGLMPHEASIVLGELFGLIALDAYAHHYSRFVQLSAESSGSGGDPRPDVETPAGDD